MDAEVDLGPVGEVLGIAVRMTINLPGMDKAAAQQLVDTAHQGLPLSNATISQYQCGTEDRITAITLSAPRAFPFSACFALGKGTATSLRRRGCPGPCLLLLALGRASFPPLTPNQILYLAFLLFVLRPQRPSLRLALL